MCKGRRKVILRIQKNKWKEKWVKRKRLKYLSVAEKVTLILWMRKWRKSISKRKILEYISVGEEVELILRIRKWKYGHPQTRSSYRNNKYQRGDSFRTDEKKGKNSIPRMGWFCASETFEILNVSWPFITWWSNEGQVDWWIKLQKLRAFKEKDNKQVICWYYIQKREFIIHP